MSDSIPPASFTGVAPSREQFLKTLAGAIQRVMDDPALGQSPLLNDLKGIGRRVDLPLVVAVAGQHGVGKSAMLNAVFGAVGMIPEGVLPAPGCRVVVQHGATAAVEAQFAGNQRTAFDPDAWVNAGDYEAIRDAERLDIRLPHELLRHAVFVDTPGLFSPEERDRKLTEDTLLGAEALVWVSSCLSPLPPSEIDGISRYCRHFRGRSVCVLVHMGELSDPRRELSAAIEHIQRAAPNFFSAVAPIDAMAAVPEVARPTVEAIKRVILSRREAIKVFAASEAARGLLSRRRALFEQESGARAQKNGVSEARRRLESLVSEHTREVARVWDTARGALRRAEEDLAANVLGKSREVTEQVAYQRKKVGLLKDDHFVEWEQVVTWQWPVELVEPAEKSLRTHAAKALSVFTDEVVASVTRLMSSYADIVRNLGEISPDAAPLVDLLAGQTTLFGKYAEQLWRKLSAYFWGGMKCGGPRGLCAWMAQQRLTFRPGPKGVQEMVESWVPLQKTRDLGDKYLKEYREALEERHTAWLNAVTAAVLVGARTEISATETLAAVALMLNA